MHVILHYSQRHVQWLLSDGGSVTVANRIPSGIFPIYSWPLSMICLKENGYLIIDMFVFRSTGFIEAPVGWWSFKGSVNLYVFVHQNYPKCSKQPIPSVGCEVSHRYLSYLIHDFSTLKKDLLTSTVPFWIRFARRRLPRLRLAATARVAHLRFCGDGDAVFVHNLIRPTTRLLGRNSGVDGMALILDSVALKVWLNKVAPVSYCLLMTAWVLDDCSVAHVWVGRPVLVARGREEMRKNAAGGL